MPPLSIGRRVFGGGWIVGIISAVAAVWLVPVIGGDAVLLRGDGGGGCEGVGKACWVAPLLLGGQKRLSASVCSFRRFGDREMSGKAGMGGGVRSVVAAAWGLNMGNGDKGVSPLDGHAVAPDWMQGRIPQGYVARKEEEQEDFEDEDHGVEDEDEVSREMTESQPVDRAGGEVVRSVLPDLRPFTRSKGGGLMALMTLLDSYTVNGTEIALTPTDAAIALHCLNLAARAHFHELQGVGAGARRGGGVRGRGKAEKAMHARLFQALLRGAIRGMWTLSPSKVGMVVGAAASLSSVDPLLPRALRAASSAVQRHAQMLLGAERRSRWSDQTPEPHHLLKPITAKTISVIVSCFTRCGYPDTRLFSVLGETLLRLPPEEFSAQSLSMIMTAYAKPGMMSGELGDKLVKTCLLLPEAKIDGQACADMITAMSKAGIGRDVVLGLISRVSSLNRKSLHREGRHYGAGGGVISGLLSAFMISGVKEPDALKTLSELARAEDISTFDSRSIAGILQGYAVLNAKDDDLIQFLAGVLCKSRIDSVTPQAVSNIAWSCAVLQIEEPALLAWVWRTLDWHIGSMEVAGLSQVHQFLLNCKLMGFTKSDVLSSFYESDVDEVLSGIVADREVLTERRCRDAFVLSATKERSRMSAFQKDVARCVKEVGGEVFSELEGMPSREWLLQEHIDEVSGYSFDLLVPTLKLVIEVDGPSHFITLVDLEETGVPQAVDKTMTKSMVPSGKTVMKHRHLRKLGWQLISVPFTEWPGGDDSSKKEYMRVRLASVKMAKLG